MLKSHYIKPLIGAVLIAAVSFSSCKKSDTGTEGPQGEQGIAGADGSAILSGSGAPTATLGKTGDFYIDKTAVSLYGPKTDSGWGSSTSLKGADGQDGTAGSKILSGSTTPVSTLGVVGDFYFNTAAADLYGPKTASGWGTPVNLKGPQDDTGNGGVQTFIYSNQQFSSVTLTNTETYETYDDNNNPMTVTTYDLGSKLELLPVSNYGDYYENGLVLIYLRDLNDTEEAWVSYIDDYDKHLGVYTDEGIKKDKIIISGYEGTRDDLNGNELKNLRFDVKIVLVPAGSVTKLSLVNTKNLKLVERALGL